MANKERAEVDDGSVGTWTGMTIGWRMNGVGSCLSVEKKRGIAGREETDSRWRKPDGKQRHASYCTVLTRPRHCGLRGASEQPFWRSA